jgi:hypothetical protein
LEKEHRWFIFWEKTEKGPLESSEWGVTQTGWNPGEVVSSLPMSQEGSMKEVEV